MKVVLATLVLLIAPFASAQTIECQLWDGTNAYNKPTIEASEKITEAEMTLISASEFKTELFSCDGLYHPAQDARGAVLIAEIYDERGGLTRVAQSETVLAKGHGDASTLVTYIYDHGNKSAACKCTIKN